MLSVVAALGLTAMITADQTPEEMVVPLVNGVVGRLPSNSKGMLTYDALEDLMVSGNWSSPGVGEKHGTTWERADFDASGRLSGRGAQNAVVVLTHVSDKTQPAILEPLGASNLYFNGVLRTGDVYANGALGLPITLKKGKNEFVFMMGRGQLQPRLVLGRKLIGLDLRDFTSPDVVEGQENLSKWFGVIVRNGGSLADDLSITVRPEKKGRTITTKLPRVLAEGLRKVPVEFDPKAEPLVFKVELRRGIQVLDTQPVKLNKVKEIQVHKRTFISQVDGSLQYFAVNPSSKPGKGQALYLSLHGASVEALGQAQAYGQKDWAYLAAATNRRPYGFNWEDIGRLDAFEVLALAEKQLGTDPMRRYLTGHSMGGHGTWHLSWLYPDQWAGASPAAGWISLFTYASRAPQFDMNDPVEKTLRQATNASDAFLFKNNLMRVPIYVLHGDADETVSVDHPRRMKEFLAGHFNFGYHEEQGQGHWYDTDPEPGANCLDYKPINEWFKGLKRRSNDEVKDVDFTTVSTRISATQHWVEALGQEDNFAPSRIALKINGSEVAGTTENIKAFALHPPASWPVSFTVRVDGSEFKIQKAKSLTFIKSASGWKARAPLSLAERNSMATLGFKDVFNRRFLAVVGISGTTRESAWAWDKVRFDNELTLDRGNGSSATVTDKELVSNPGPAKGRNVLLYGHADMNKAWSLYVPATDQLKRADKSRGGLLSWVKQGEDKGIVAAIAGTDLNALKRTDRLPIFTPGQGAPAKFIRDWR
jgi:pimeloyl-ACP methyl ester carboxylesterase